MTRLKSCPRTFGKRPVYRRLERSTVHKMMAWKGSLFTAIFACFVLMGCAVNASESSETYGAQIGIVNHTGNYIYSASVGDGGGGSSFPYHAGIANICCVSLPKIWKPGLEYVVRWDVPEGRKHNAKEKLVKVERYDETGSLYVHFFDNDEIRIVVTRWYGESKNHPIPPPPPGAYKPFQ
jgi:hypothetical protein